MSVETERSSTESSGASGLDFEDTALTLTLRLPGDADRKRSASDAGQSSSLAAAAAASGAPPAPKAQVVGWPPVRSFRKNALADAAAAGSTARAAPPKFVKVAVDGAPYLRKVNLQGYAGYDPLLRALQDKFCSHFTIRRFANDETKLVDAVNGTEYVPTYEDKDGDWMLVGDVPWKKNQEPEMREAGSEAADQCVHSCVGEMLACQGSAGCTTVTAGVSSRQMVVMSQRQLTGPCGNGCQDEYLGCIDVC